MRVLRGAVLGFVLALPGAVDTVAAERCGERQEEASGPKLQSRTFCGLELRSIGPALMSGRIADIAIHPEDDSVWYIAVGSGNVWKTENAGTTWQPIFDDEGSYSIGAIALDPGNPEIVWVGTGENVGGRHVGYGDLEDHGSWELRAHRQDPHRSTRLAGDLCGGAGAVVVPRWLPGALQVDRRGRNLGKRPP